MAAEWSSLEIAKLIVSFLTPVVVVALGFMVTNAARRVEQAQESNRRLIERRLELYDEMAEMLNDLYCFFRMVGHFRDVDPPAAIEKKRKLDKSFYANKFLMTTDFSSLYRSFMNEACFVPWGNAGEDAKLRSSVAKQKFERGSQAKWEDEWDDLFVTNPQEVTPAARITSSYEELMERFAEDCGVKSAEETRANS